MPSVCACVPPRLLSTPGHPPPLPDPAHSQYRPPPVGEQYYRSSLRFFTYDGADNHVSQLEATLVSSYQQLSPSLLMNRNTHAVSLSLPL
ncbi:hypothetical protein GJAV_G00037030 [Gymnothorax javanicus]|nr:hypothetical protein GJAV_G00037030 [Gymnothorax javanicus]